MLPLGLHVASALHYLAAEGVVHLDVKPSNIVMGAPAAADRPQRRADARRGRGALRSPIGTDAYMAPEQCAPDGGSARRPTCSGLAATLHAVADGAAVARRARARPAPPRARSSPAARRARSPTSSAPALTRTRPHGPPRASSRSALEPLVAALPRRLTLGRRS